MNDDIKYLRKNGNVFTLSGNVNVSKDLEEITKDEYDKIIRETDEKINQIIADLVEQETKILEDKRKVALDKYPELVGLI